MRKLLTIFLLLLSLTLSATDYYVSSTGSDAANGTSQLTPWQTLNKVYAPGFYYSPGDRILFKRGDTFYGELTVISSGTSVSRITYGAYGTGANPVISGFTTVTGWSNYGGGIYRKAISPESVPNMVTLNGVNMGMGRYPNNGAANSGWDINATWNSGSSLTDASLSGFSSLVGANIVAKRERWYLSRSTITYHSGSTINFNELYGSRTLRLGDGFFVQNSIQLCDQLGEWAYTGGYLYMYFGSVDPTTQTVKVSTLDNLIYINNKDYVTIENLDVQGGNVYGISIISSDRVTINASNVSFIGQKGIYSDGSCPYLIIQYCNISHSNDAGVYTTAGNVTLQYNNITYSGYLQGMGTSTDNAYCGVVCEGDNGVIYYNKVQYLGGMGIRFGGHLTVVSYNLVTDHARWTGDVAGIYTFRGLGDYRTIDHNIILYGYCEADGWDYYEKDVAEGIYLDGAQYMTITNNVIGENNGSGIFLNGNTYATVQGNLIYGNLGSAFRLTDFGDPDLNATGDVISGNIFFAKNADEITWEQRVIGSSTARFNDFGTSTNNYFARPLAKTSHILGGLDRWSTVNYYTLAQWQTLTGLEGGSILSVPTVSNVNQLHFIYNATALNKNFSLSAAMVDHANVSYSGTVTLTPWTGKVLIGTGTVTESGGIVSPTVTTTAITSITETTASSGGNVTYDGGGTVTARGVCWSTSVNPTFLDSKTSNGTGTGAFTSSITGLTNGTTYYVRAYATNSAGTSYGTQYSFTTSATPDPPVIISKGLVKSGSTFVKSGNSLIIIE